MIYYVINVVTYLDAKGSPQKVLPGTSVDSADTVRYQQIVSAGGVLWSAVIPQILAAANLAAKAKRNGADEFALQSIMQGGVNQVTSQGDRSGEPVFVAAGPTVQKGKVLLATSGGVRLGDAAGWLVSTVICGIALIAADAGAYTANASTGTLPPDVTGLTPYGVSTAVGFDANGNLVRAIDTTCVPGAYVGDADPSGNFVFGIRKTPLCSDYALVVWAQPTWDIDAQNPLASDLNTGLAGFPLKTATEQHRRVGPIHEINNDPPSTTPKVKMRILSPLQADDVLTIRLLVRPSSVTFTGNNKVPYMGAGTPALVAGGAYTIASVRAHNNTVGNGAAWGINVGGSLAAHRILGRIAIKTNAVVNPLYPQAWWIAKDNDDGAGMVRVSYPTFLDSTDVVNGSNGGTFTGGDTFQLYDLPVIPRLHVECVNAAFAINLRRLRASAGYTTGTGAFTAVECTFDSSAWTGVFPTRRIVNMEGSSFGDRRRRPTTRSVCSSTRRYFLQASPSSRTTRCSRAAIRSSRRAEFASTPTHAGSRSSIRRATAGRYGPVICWSSREA